MNPIDRYIDIGIRMHVREWGALGTNSPKPPFLLVHGLASNARTWDQVAEILSAAGHPVAAIDQRGHGLSQKPDDGYDFAAITGDLDRLLGKLNWHRPVLAGQSWGGNVLLEFGARFPRSARGLIFIDGGFLNLSQRGSWESITAELRPPDLAGTPRDQIASQIKQYHPTWSHAGVEATLHNFETLPDGTVRPWLTLERHMLILRAMYEQNPTTLYPAVEEPVLICVADNRGEMFERKRMQVQSAVKGLKQVEVVDFPDTAHDIHVDRPEELAARFLEFSSQFSNLT